MQSARLYAGWPEVAVAYQELAETYFRDAPRRKFVAEVEVNVRTGQEFDREELSQYLGRAAAIYLDTKNNGDGPTRNCLTQIEIEWGNLKEVPA